MPFHISRQQHLRNAAIIWVLVGIMLITRGLIWLLADKHLYNWVAFIVPAAVVVGMLKGNKLLRNSAVRAIDRINQLAERTPFWHLYSPSMYLLILSMIGLGFAFRIIGAHWHVIGFVGALYLIIGVALVTGSYAYWRAHGQHHSDTV